MINKKNICIVAYGAHGTSMSGGDRLFIEFCRRWSKKYNITMLVTKEGETQCKKNKLKNVKYKTVNLQFFKKFGFWPRYLASIIYGLYFSLKTDIQPDIIYAGSDFWMDIFPMLIIQKRKKSKSIGTFYLVAPHPLKGFKKGMKKSGWKIPKLNEFFYYLSQIPAKRVLKYSDGIFVTNNSIRNEVKKYTKKPIFVTKGGVDNSLAKKVPRQKQKFEAVFIGRFHEQKGVVELIDIWKDVCKKIPKAKLALIGDGPLDKIVRQKVKEENLQNNIKFFGFLDGEEKIKVFKQSKIVLHTEIYGVGSMAPVEAMTCGLPGVSFNLPDFKNYYTGGMLFSRNNNEFSKNIIKLLENKNIYSKKSTEALKLAKEFDWNLLSERAYKFIEELHVS